ncbi:MAG: serine/threonine protein kinase, bacterial [Thermosediminibacterales bacterium]|nr:serine/threonine protein kinase, bacterial [Thermosediminibacterales bacterium]
MNELHLPAGYTIIGRWTGKKFVIRQVIGRGGIGKVYRAYNPEQKEEVAVKIGRNLSSLTKEYECLKRLKGVSTIPEVYCLDDCKVQNKTFYFFSMELIKGQNLRFLMVNYNFKLKEALYMTLLIAALLNRLHSLGYVYCDLKPENIVYNTENRQIKLIDFGGIVEKGKGVKEFTPCFDRASWKMGSRWADEKYDVFSLTMFLYVLLNGKIVLPGDKNKLIAMINGLKKATPQTKELLKKGFFQKYNNTAEFFCDLKHVIDNQSQKSVLKKELNVDMVLNIVFLFTLVLTSVFFVMVLKKLGMV